MAAKPAQGFADLLGKIKRPEKTVVLCLAGDLQAEFEVLERELQAVREQPADQAPTLGSAKQDPRAVELAQQIEALRKQMQEHTVVFRFRGLSSHEYSQLVTEHPPTEEDRAKGADVEWKTFPAGLIAACMISPELDLEEVRTLAKELTQAQWDALYAGALSVNKKGVDVPFSYNASAVLRSSAPSSK